MDKQNVIDTLTDLYETYQYLITKVELTKETLENNGPTISEFEEEKIKDIFESIISKNSEIAQDLQTLKAS
ncbi:hypothetical protein [Flexithrix dorotheae]|uniref:hypothetical protein n=1 Tax=Flexithrix dorotheae TaxID=70993 RepID=UPI00039E252B|nr:hypothetical protein [Flexithrix dorotheae]